RRGRSNPALDRRAGAKVPGHDVAGPGFAARAGRAGAVTVLSLADRAQVRPHSDPLAKREGIRRVFVVVAFPFVLAAASAVAWVFAANTSLGLYLGGLALVSVLAPPLVAAADDRLRAALALAAVVAGIGAVWLFAA